MKDIGGQRPSEFLSKNTVLASLHELIAKRAMETHKVMDTHMQSRATQVDGTPWIESLVSFISTITIGEIITKATAEANTHPSPTARTFASTKATAGRKAMKDIEETQKGEGSHKEDAMLQRAAECLLYKLEGTTSHRWRATTQLMTWVANDIPMLATTLLPDIFPATNIRKKDREPNTVLMNTATPKQWNNLATAEKEMPDLLKFKPEQWESGKDTNKHKLKMITNTALTQHIKKLNALFLLEAVAELANIDSLREAKRNKVDHHEDSKRAAKEALRNSYISGARGYLDTSEAQYDEASLERAIKKAYESGKERLGKLVDQAHQDAKRDGTDNPMKRFLTEGNTACPDCNAARVTKYLVGDPKNPSKAIFDHLNHCGEEGRKRKRATPTDNNGAKRNNLEPPRNGGPSPGPSVRGASQRGRVHGNNRGRGNYMGNTFRGQPEWGPQAPRNMNNREEYQGSPEMVQPMQRNNGQGFGYHTQEYRERNDSRNFQQNQGPWMHQQKFNGANYNGPRQSH